ncbi:MAG: HAMP domain-containing sensor histidine kinase [Clostridiales bacterium]|nr:HAMP domain-containing sensor histidine kinase [Clostridiales bacterium]
MKFWKKIFFACISLFLILYVIAGCLLIERIHREKLQVSIQTSRSKFAEIENSIYLNADYALYDNFQSEAELVNWLETVINGFYMSNDFDFFNIEVFRKDNRLLMSNVKYDSINNRIEIVEANRECSFLIRKVNDKRYLFVSGLINVNNEEYKLVVSNSIETLWESKLRDYGFFLWIGIGMTVVMAGLLYVITKRLTDPIEKLSEVSKDIQQGDYSKRVSENGTSKEVAILQKNFNQMIDDMQMHIKRLQDLSESKQRFIDSLNHEIRTPITSILGYSDLLLKGKVTKEIERKALTYINQEAKRLEVINKTLVKLIVIQQIEEPEEKVSIIDAFHSVEIAMLYKCEQRKIELIQELDEAYVIINRNHLQLLLINIIDNAIKASACGSKVEVKGKKNNRKYELRVRDFGIGIPKEDLDKVFEAFYMVDKARTRKENGLGLGLAICHEICKRYQIELKIESEINKGTEIILNIKLEEMED